jgi:hypothetical protein
LVPDTEKISENIFFFYFSIFYYTNVFLQANEELAKFGRPKSTPSKVKVQPGASNKELDAITGQLNNILNTY